MAWVIAGHDNLVGSLRGLRHQRALARIAVATAAEHTPQLAAACIGDWTQGLHSLGKRIGSVRIVHHGQRLVITTDQLHATWYSRALRNCASSIGQTHTQRV